MSETAKRNSGLWEILGLIGVLLAILGMSDMALEPRLICLLGGAICLPVSFSGQSEWPIWVRWLLALAATAFLASVGWSALRNH